MVRELSEKEATEHLKGLRKDLQIRLDKLDVDIADIERRLGNKSPAFQALTEQRRNLVNIYSDSIDRAKVGLQRAKERAANEQREEEARRKASEDATKGKFFSEWEKAGGKRDAFEEAWPSLYQKYLSEKTLQAVMSERDDSPITRL